MGPVPAALASENKRVLKKTWTSSEHCESWQSQETNFESLGTGELRGSGGTQVCSRIDSRQLACRMTGSSILITINVTKAGSLELAAVVVYRYSQWVPQHVLGPFGFIYQ